MSETNTGAIRLAGIEFTAYQLVWRAVHNVSRDNLRGRPFWGRVKEVFGVGSNVAADMCRVAGLDPDTGKDL